MRLGVGVIDSIGGRGIKELIEAALEVVEGPCIDARAGVRIQVEAGDNAEVVGAALERLEEIGVGLGVCGDNAAVA